MHSSLTGSMACRVHGGSFTLHSKLLNLMSLSQLHQMAGLCRALLTEAETDCAGLTLDQTVQRMHPDPNVKCTLQYVLSSVTSFIIAHCNFLMAP
jgi:hypothetical protein